MAQAEQPERLRPEHQVTVDDVRQLMGASTPHFALQLRNRIRAPDRAAAARRPGARARGAGDRAARAARLHAARSRGEGFQDGQRALPSLGDDEPTRYADGPTTG